MIFSIRRRLLFLLLSLICGVWGIVTWCVYIDTQHEVEELFDANLAQNAHILFGLLKHEMDDDDDDEIIELAEDLIKHKYEHKLAFIIRDKKRKILIRSTTAPFFPKPRKKFHSYRNYQINGHLWRVFTLKYDHFYVQTGERHDIRDELISEIIFSTLSILLMALPLLALFIWISVGHSFKSLQKIATDIAGRTPEQLKPLDKHKIPLEIKELVNAINNLFIQLEQAFENERRFTADAAHELRTPLAGIKIQAQVAQRAINPQQALQQILIGVDRATHLVAQLLTLARMDATQEMHISRIDMHELISHLIIDLTEQALEKKIDLGLETTAISYVIQGNQDALYLMLRNLLDNAIRYTPENGQVTVSLENHPSSQLTLSIIDTGPGIPLSLRKQIFKRFYRGDNQNIQGSGLGLSIAQKVAQLHNVKIQLNDGHYASGLCVRMDFI
ncbi:MAG: sensor histidine kinase N-terminal domain-containing protein [Thiotrichaceae bacterium]|nr:sensor histidine kinase N-terminal domain-containing protein [Thiotrichaceae bacterium]